MIYGFSCPDKTIKKLMLSCPDRTEFLSCVQ
nr:MAG TPA: hypothetical protein [Caudoviricetes sp.]